LSSPPLVADFVQTRADMAAFQRVVTARVRRDVRSPAYYAGLTTLAVVAGALLSGVAGLRLHAPTAAAVLLLGLVVWWFISKLYRGAVAPLEDGSLVGPRRIELDDDGVRQIARLHEARTRWPGVLAVDTTDAHIFLMTDRLAGYIVPRRAFADTGEAEAFAAFARARAGGGSTARRE
jgi:hypothetical protein